jgi:hypothetical protein
LPPMSVWRNLLLMGRNKISTLFLVGEDNKLWKVTVSVIITYDMMMSSYAQFNVYRSALWWIAFPWLI